MPPWGFESPLRHHRNTQREFGLAPSSLFSKKRLDWLKSGSWVYFRGHLCGGTEGAVAKMPRAPSRKDPRRTKESTFSFRVSLSFRSLPCVSPSSPVEHTRSRSSSSWPSCHLLSSVPFFAASDRRHPQMHRLAKSRGRRTSCIVFSAILTICSWSFFFPS